MAKENTSPKVMFLVGAGASVALNIPHMKSMVKEFLKDSENTQYSSTIKILDDLGVSKDLEEMLFEVDKILELPKSPIDKIYSQSTGSQANGEYIASLHDNMFQLKEHILLWVSEKCWRFDRIKSDQLWGNLVESINDKNIPIFTTNYDFAIEWTALEKRNIVVVDNFKQQGSNRYFWDPTLNSLNKKGLKVIKLHGSINWYTTKNKEKIERLVSSSIANEEGLPIERVAIFPTRFKDIYDTHFFSLYKYFLNALDKSNLIIVIGHSLRDAYLRAAIRERFRDTNFKLLYVGPEKQDFTDFKLSQKQIDNQIVFIEGPFEDFSYQMAFILGKYDANKFSNILESVINYKNNPEIVFYGKVTHVLRGDLIAGKIKVNAPAIPSATLIGKMINSDPIKGTVIDISVTTDSMNNSVVFEGIEELTQNIVVTIPNEIEDGKYKLIFDLVQEENQVIATKHYISNVGSSTESSNLTDVEKNPTGPTSDSEILTDADPISDAQDKSN